MNKVFAILFFLLLSAEGMAQTDFTQKYEEFVKSSMDKHQSFSQKSSDDFIKALQENWKTFYLYDADIRRRKNSSDSLFRKKEELKKGDHQIDISDVPVKNTVVKPSSASTDAFSPMSSVGMKKVQFDYYGESSSVSVPSKLGMTHPSGMTEKSVASFWDYLSSFDIHPFISECNRIRAQKKLNDWAFYEWISCLSAALFPENLHSEQCIFTVFCLNQMGLRCKIARTNLSLIPIFSSEQEVYGRKYVLIDKTKYYLAEDNQKITRIETYEVDVQSRLHGLDLNLAEHPRIGGQSDTVFCVKSSVLKGEMSLPGKTRIFDFYDSYPQMDVNMYATAATDIDFSEVLLRKMKSLLGETKGEDAVNLLLHFVQSDFGYRNDKDQFGKEKPFFCEENFAYPFNDCEDRVVLFVYLVRNLLDYDCILLDYDDHINCAVNIRKDVSGYYVRRGDSKFYVCDPTYIGASLGQSPKDYRVKPQSVWVL